MDHDPDDAGIFPVSVADARAALERAFADKRLHLSDRNKAFLRYLAEENFSGESKGVKAYVIAVNVFKRPSNFDPNLDPIVRIEATRLRTALEQYYQMLGDKAAVKIRIPRGSYVAQFYTTSALAPDEAHDDMSVPEAEDAASDVPHPPLQERASSPSALAAIGAGCVIATGLLLFFQPFDWAEPMIVVTSSSRPVISVVSADSGRHTAASAELQEALVMSLSRFGSLSVRSNMTTDTGTARGGLRGLSEQGDFVVTIRYDFHDGTHTGQWKVIDGRSRNILATGTQELTGDQATGGRLLSLLGQNIAIVLGSSEGVIPKLVIDSDTQPLADGYGCVLRADRARSRMKLAEFAANRKCLQKLISANARDADAAASLSRLVVAQDEMSNTRQNASSALALADQAVTVSPQNPDNLAALMSARYLEGQVDASLAAGRAALDFNPLDPDIAASLALRLILQAKGTEAVALIGQHDRSRIEASWDGSFALALNAYLNNKPGDALTLLSRVGDDKALVPALRIACLLTTNRIDEAKAAFHTRNLQPPAFLRETAAALDIRQAKPAISTKLLRDLAAVHGW